MAQACASRAVMALTPVTDIGLWARSSGLEIVLFVTGAVLLTRFASWLGGRITARIDARSGDVDAIVRTEAAKHRQAAAQGRDLDDPGAYLLPDSGPGHPAARPAADRIRRACDGGRRRAGIRCPAHRPGLSWRDFSWWPNIGTASATLSG